MANFYQSFYNGHRPTATDRLNCCRGHEAASDKQRAYFDALESFLKERDLYDGFLGKPRNRNECKSKINAMHTILKKHGLQDEWAARDYYNRR